MSTTVITRLYRDTKSAEAVLAALLEAGQKRQTIDIIDQSSASRAPALRKRMVEARVNNDDAAAYAKGVEGGNALVVVRAPFVPFGTASRAIEIVDGFKPIDVGVKDQNAYTAEERIQEFTLSVLPNSPRFLTGKVDGNRTTVSKAFHIPLLSDRRPRDNSVIPGGALISKKFLPLPMLTREKRRDSVIHGGALVSTKFLPFPLLTPDRHPYSVMRGGGTPLSEIFGLPLLSKRQ